MITGFKDTSNSLNTKVQPTTVQNVGRFRQGVDTVAQVYFEDVTTDTSEAGSSYNTINATGHSANVGDLIEITSGTYNRVKVFVQSVTTDQIVLSQRFPTELGASVTFTICAPAVPKVNSAGAVSVSAAITSPIEDGGSIGVDAVLATIKVPIKRATYTTNAAGDASTLNFASHAMQVGDWAYWRTGKEFRQVTARTATQVTVSPAFSSAPGTSASIEYYRTMLPRYVYEAGVSGATGGFLGIGGVYDDGAGSVTPTMLACSSTGYLYANAQITSPLAIVSPNHNGVATDTMVGEKLISTHTLTNSSTTTTFALGSTLTEDVYAGDIAEIYVTATGRNLQRTKIGSYAASGSSQVTALVADALYYTPDNTYSIRILRRQGLRTANSAPGSTDFGVVVRGVDDAAMAASLSVLDDWDESDRAKVNLIAGQAGVQGGSGTVSANTQRVVLATDVALPAGTNAIGKLAANSGVDIGDVDVTSLPSLPAGTNNIGDVDVLTLPGVDGSVAHDAADSGNPVKVGYRARTANITAVAQDDRVDGIADPHGRQLVQGSLSGTRFKGRNASLITNTTSTQLIAAGGSGVIYVITAITVTNTHASTSTEVTILDGSTVVWSGPAAAGYGGFSISFPDGLVCTANTAINAQCATSGASVRACVTGHTIT